MPIARPSLFLSDGVYSLQRSKRLTCCAWSYLSEFMSSLPSLQLFLRPKSHLSVSWLSLVTCWQHLVPRYHFPVTFLKDRYNICSPPSWYKTLFERDTEYPSPPFRLRFQQPQYMWRVPARTVSLARVELHQPSAVLDFHGSVFPHQPCCVGSCVSPTVNVLTIQIHTQKHVHKHMHASIFACTVHSEMNTRTQILYDINGNIYTYSNTCASASMRKLKSYILERKKKDNILLQKCPRNLLHLAKVPHRQDTINRGKIYDSINSSCL